MNENSENETPDPGSEANSASTENVKDEPANKNDKPETRTFSADVLLNNAAGFSFVFSSVFLIAGVSYNLGLFLFIDPKLVTLLTLSDHISTSISISLTLVAVGFVLILISLLLISVVCWILLLPAWLSAKFGSSNTSAATSPETDSSRSSNGQTTVKQGRSDQTKFVYDHGTIILPATCNIVLYLIIIYGVVPDEMREKFNLLIFILAIFGTVAIFLYSEYILIHREKRGYLRIGSVAILLYLLSFQLGVLDAGMGYRFVYDETHSRPYAINEFDEAHLFRAASNGVFFTVRQKDKTMPAAIYFEPWPKIKKFRYQVRPATGS